MDINRTHASSAQSEPQSPSEESRSPARAAPSNPPAATEEPGGALASLAGRRRSRSPDADEVSEQPDAAAGAQPPRKKLRTAHGVRFAEPAREGAASGSGPSSSQPMARQQAMPRHEAEDPEQRDINEQIARNQRALIDRLHVERQPAAAFMRQDWFLAEAGQHLTPSDQHTLLNDVLHLPEEARVEFARLLPSGLAGAYLSRDEQALAHALGGGSPDVVVRRAGWLMRAGLAGRHFPGALRSELMSRTIEQAEADLRAHFEHGGPSAQANAVLDLVASALFAPALEDAHRFAQLALQPQYFRALPDSQRASALSLLCHGLLSANAFAWIALSSTAGGAAAGDEHDVNAARVAAFAAVHRNALAEIMPMVLETARGIASMTSSAAHGILFAASQMAGRGMPDVDAQRALLDLYDHLLAHVEGPERDQAYTGLSTMISALGEPGLRRRAFNLVTGHRPGAARASDWLAHLDPSTRTGVLLTVIYQLNTLDDELRDDAFGLLLDQTAPGTIEQFPGDARQRLLEQARELDAPPGDNLRLLAVVGRLLDHAPVNDIVQSLEVLFGHANEAVEDDALEQAVWQQWDRFLPQLPADASAHLLAHAVAVDPAYMPFAMRRFVSVDASRLHAMLGALNDPRSAPMASDLVERGTDEPDALHATLQTILAELPPAQRAAAASSIAQVLVWSATAMPEPARPQAVRNSVREAVRILNDTPAQARAAVLAAYLRPEPAQRVGPVAYQYLANAMFSGNAQQFHRWLDAVPVSERLSIAVGVARLLPSARGQAAAARAVTVVEGLYPRSLQSWSDHHALVGALTDALARWPATFDVERLRIGAMIEHGIRALPPGAEHAQALLQLAAMARQLPQGASSSSEATPGTHAWAMQLIQLELGRTDDATRERVLGEAGE